MNFCPFQKFAALAHRFKLVNGQKMIVLAVNLTRAHLARGYRNRHRQIAVIGHQGARDRGLAGPGRGCNDQHDAATCELHEMPPKNQLRP